MGALFGVPKMFSGAVSVVAACLTRMAKEDDLVKFATIDRNETKLAKPRPEPSSHAFF
jgi:hypothetical protein